MALGMTVPLQVEAPAPPQPVAFKEIALAYLVSLAAIILLLIYSGAFQIKPAADDFTVINEIHRGDQRGVVDFFRHSLTGVNYRPLKSLTIWLCGRASGNAVYTWIRVAHLSSLALFAAVVMLWARMLPIGRAGIWATAILAFFHPVLVQAYGSIDGLDSLISTAMLWLGTWFVWKYRDRLFLATILALACFAFGVLYKEYAFALVPNTALVMLCFRKKRRWFAAFSMGGIVLLALAAILFVRRYTVPEGYGGGWGYILLDASQIPQNMVMLLASVFLFVNTLWIFLHPDALGFGLCGVAILIAAATIAYGVWQRIDPVAPAERKDADDCQASVARWVVFLLLSFITASFPITIMSHVSEMYVPPIVPPMILLAAIGVDGYRRCGIAARSIAGTVALAAMVLSIVAIHQKLQGLKHVGDLAESQINQILSYLAPDVHDKTIDLVFDKDDSGENDTYAVFRMGENMVLVHPTVLDWPEPKRNLRIKVIYQINPETYENDTADIILRWRFEEKKFVPHINSPRERIVW